MSKNIFKIFCVCLVTLMMTTQAKAAEYNLKMQTWYAPTMAMASTYFVEQVEKLTGGKVKIMLFTAGELVTSSNILKSVRGGMLDIGYGMGHHFSERKSGTVESGLPMSWMSPVEAQIIYDRYGLRELIEEEYASLDVQYLGPVWAVPYTTLSKTPINSLDDMRKMKIRAVGATAKMLTSLGISTVNLPPEDIYLSLTTGQIDGVVYGSAAEYKESKFYEVAPYINVTPIIDPIADSLIINKKRWDSFPPHIQAAIQAAADMTMWKYYIWQSDESLKVLDELFKGKITTFSAEDIQTMTKAAALIWDEEGKKSPEAKRGIEILKTFAKSVGR